MIKSILISFSCILCCSTISAEDTNSIVVNVAKPGAAISPTMYGIFFEDINFAADGGLYAEKIKNRSFEFPQHLMGWKTMGDIELRSDGPFPRAPHYLRLTPPVHKYKRTIIENEGFFGISTVKDQDYRFSFWARCPQGDSAKINVSLADKLSFSNQTTAKGSIAVSDGEWKKYTLLLTATKTLDKQILRLTLNKGVVDIEHVSLFPVNTWKGRENGMRRDLAQALYDLHPGVFRFPGGCIVEGTDTATRYKWKDGVGPVENRHFNENRWQYAYGDYIFPDYYQSYGLGFYEFFQLCEDFGCEALPVISCGLACQYTNDEIRDGMENIDRYIQDALDLIEFANGDTTTHWGKVRADMGHPAPFNMHYLAIGNEQWDYKDGNNAFTTRLKAFLDVMRKKHPEIKYIGSTGPNAEDWRFKMLQPKMKELKVDLYDEHYYRNEEWFTDSINLHRYDSYDRKGPKVFAGEYACHPMGKKWNHFKAALLEAAFMTGFERNADVVRMATYAPLFAHIEGVQWRPDMIWFDNQRMMKTSSYYVQQLYSKYKGTNILPIKKADNVSASAVIDKKQGQIYLKIANTSDKPQQVSYTLKGLRGKDHSCKQILLTAPNLDSENTLDNPDVIKPAEKAIALDGNILKAELPKESFSVFIIQ